MSTIETMEQDAWRSEQLDIIRARLGSVRFDAIQLWLTDDEVIQFWEERGIPKKLLRLVTFDPADAAIAH